MKSPSIPLFQSGKANGISVFNKILYPTLKKGGKGGFEFAPQATTKGDNDQRDLKNY